MKVFRLLLLMFLIHNICHAQDTLNKNNSKKFLYQNSFQLENSNQSSLYNRSAPDKKTNRTENIVINFFKSKIREEQSFDLLSTVGNNISFGGFWDRYAVINFTPQLNIRPVSFISIYANRNLNCFIPISGIKEYYQSVLIQSAAILAIDKSLNFFLDSKNWITDVITFAAKNLIVSLLIKPAIDNTSNTPKPMFQFESYYYSFRITF
ncbi:MAG: hypothetical protein ABI462_03890 [Ignavibacteria bacterium]